jgi:alanine dehydrogenase
MSLEGVPTPAGRRAAFEIAKGELPVLFLSEADVVACLDLSALLDALADGFADVERGLVQSPGRPGVTVPDRGFSLAMPAWRPGDLIAVKVVNVFDGNLALGLPNHLAMITLFDPDTGATRCVMDGTYVTGVRTAAAAALSTRLLARADARVATIVGAGVQAREHLRVLPLVREFERINMCALVADDARRLAERSPIAVGSTDVRAAVESSDVVCLATHSPRPVLDANWVRPGTHVSSVGYFPPDGELPRDLLTMARLFVETVDAFEPAPVGCSELAGADRAAAATLGAVALDAARGRRTDDEITVYKAMGIAMEDLVAANLAYRAAVATGRGQTIGW